MGDPIPGGMPAQGPAMPASMVMPGMPVLQAPAPPQPGRIAAGAIIVAAAVGAGLGAVLGGLWGAGSGLLLAGAGANAWRAQRSWGAPDPTVRGEAAKSATMAVFGVGIGGWLAYKAYKARTEDED